MINITAGISTQERTHVIYVPGSLCEVRYPGIDYLIITDSALREIRGSARYFEIVASDPVLTDEEWEEYTIE